MSSPSSFSFSIEQNEFLGDLKHAIDVGGHCLLELPLGKEPAILSSLPMYMLEKRIAGKLVFVSPTVSAMSTAIALMKKLLSKDDGGALSNVKGVCISTRKTMRGLCGQAAVTLRGAERARRGEKKSYTKFGAEHLPVLGPGMYSLADLAVLSQDHGFCPYELAWSILPEAGVVFCTHRMLLDPKLSRPLLNVLEPESVIILDEAHNIDNVCIDAMSVTLNNQVLESALLGLDKLSNALGAANKDIEERLNDEYILLKSGGGTSSALAAGALHIDEYRKNLVKLTSKNPEVEMAARRMAMEPKASTIAWADEHFWKKKEKKEVKKEGKVDNKIHDSSTTEALDAMLLFCPVAWTEEIDEPVPGNLRRAPHFISFLRSNIEYFLSFVANRMKAKGKEKGKAFRSTPAAFHRTMDVKHYVDMKSLQFCTARLHSLLQTLVVGMSSTKPFNKSFELEVSSLVLVADFLTMLGTASKDIDKKERKNRKGGGVDNRFSVIFEPRWIEEVTTIPCASLQLACADASIAIRPIFERFSSVAVTSSTLAPLELYPRLLGFHPVVRQSFRLSLPDDEKKKLIHPLVISRGDDQTPINVSTTMANGINDAVVRCLGNVLIDVARITPDGMVGFFPSLAYMNRVMLMWDKLGVLKKLMSQKLIFCERKNPADTAIALDTFRKACDCGRGAIFLAAARGPIANFKFSRHYGRAIVILGVPFPSVRSSAIRARLTFLRDRLGIQESEFLAFDAMRNVAQCVGSAIGSKFDYAAFIFADKRFNSAQRRAKLPRWITRRIDQDSLHLSTNQALLQCRQFFRRTSQAVSSSMCGVTTSGKSKDSPKTSTKLKHMIKVKKKENNESVNMIKIKVEGKNNNAAAAKKRRLN